MIVLYLLLLLVSLPLWGWLCYRIWKVNPLGGILSFFFGIPVFYFVPKLWETPEARVRVAVFANIGILTLLVLVKLQLPDDWTQTLVKGSEYTKKARHQAERNRKNADMERWCQEKNDASYDPDLDTCVERDKQATLALGIDTAIFNHLAKHLAKSDVKGEIDHSKSVASIKLAKSSQIADVASYYFLPFSMSQPQISFYLCVSASACTSFIENVKDRSIINMIPNNSLLLVVPWDSMEEPRIKELTAAFLNFKAP